jgi:cytochrome c553
MNETLFYVLGIALVVIALIVSAIGLRFERFPTSKGVLALGLAILVVMVGATATFAWLQAADEQEHRDEEIAAGEVPSPSEVVEAEATGESVGEVEAQAEPGGGAEGGGGQPGGGGAQQGGGAQPAGGGQPSQAVLAEGERLFNDEGCAGCHSLQAAGATGEVGPNLDEALQGRPPAFIETSIVDPQAEIAQGYQPLMPTDFAQALSQEQIDALVQYLVQSTR